ncbi:MAG: hypothetical protein AAFY17_13825, partial [Cyanobacteria bacterium J06642_11]
VLLPDLADLPTWTERFVYKLAEIDGIPVMKEASGKLTYPGRKQIFRSTSGDQLGLATEPIPANAQGLLMPVMRNGERLTSDESLAKICDRTTQSVAQLPASVRDVESPQVPQVEISPSLKELTDCTRRCELATVN